MTAIMRRPMTVLPHLFSLLDNVWPFTDFGSIRVESYTDDGRFVLRAELPGVDPDEDVAITVEHGRLTVAARREQHHEDARHSEFHYGTFGRSVLLPAGARVADITANYQDGILEVTVPVDTVAKEKATKIEIRSGKDARKK
jgi:HSP20 family molecular chaperone IbpA